jgi:hypothetical protein
MEARLAALEARLKTVEAENATLRATATPKRAARGPGEMAAIATNEVNYTLIPVGADLRFDVKTRAKVYGEHLAIFHDSKRIVSKDMPHPLGKNCFASINQWATACLKKHQVAMGRKNATINVFDKGTTIYFKRGEEWVQLTTIKTITRVGEGASPAATVPQNTIVAMPPAAVGGGGSAAAAAPAEDGGDIYASQTSVFECPRCGADVEVGEPCTCEPKKCEECESAVPDGEFLGECGGCDKGLGKCCGAFENGALTCHGCHSAPEDDAELQDMDVKGIVMLFNPVTGDVFIKTAAGSIGDKVSTFKEGKHEWVWKRTMIGGIFHLVNHFNYVKKTATAGGAWVGMYDRAAKTITPTPAPEDA